MPDITKHPKFQELRDALAYRGMVSIEKVHDWLHSTHPKLGNGKTPHDVLLEDKADEVIALAMEVPNARF